MATAAESQETETYDETVDKVVSERDPKNPRKKIERTVQTVEKRTRKGADASRDYWCIPSNSSIGAGFNTSGSVPVQAADSKALVNASSMPARAAHRAPPLR